MKINHTGWIATLALILCACTPRLKEGRGSESSSQSTSENQQTVIGVNGEWLDVCISQAINTSQVIQADVLIMASGDRLFEHPEEDGVIRHHKSDGTTEGKLQVLTTTSGAEAWSNRSKLDRTHLNLASATVVGESTCYTLELNQ